MDDVEPLRWGIVGPGAIAEVFATSLARSRGGDVAAVFGRSVSRRDQFATRFGARAVESLDQLLSLDDVDAVYVATPHVHHADIVRASLDAGRAVLCEKPMTTNVEETRALVEHSRCVNVPLVEAWMYRAHPQIEHLVARLREGVIGTPRRVTSAFGFEVPFDATSRLHDPALGGGAILDVGGYPLSVALAVAQVVGEERLPGVSMHDVSGRFAASGVDACARATFDVSGLVADVAVAIDEDFGRSAVVEGDEGRVWLEDPFMPEGRRDGLVGRVTWERNDGDRVVDVVSSPHDCFALEAIEVTRLVRTGERTPRPPMIAPDESIHLAAWMASWRERLTKVTAG